MWAITAIARWCSWSISARYPPAGILSAGAPAKRAWRHKENRGQESERGSSRQTGMEAQENRACPSGRVPGWNSLSEQVFLRMANIKSQIKRNRQNEAARQRNRAVRSALKTKTKQFEQAVESGDTDSAAEALSAVTKAYDQAAAKGVVHRRKAANKKSR